MTELKHAHPQNDSRLVLSLDIRAPNAAIDSRKNVAEFVSAVILTRTGVRAPVACRGQCVACVELKTHREIEEHRSLKVLMLQR